MVRSTVNTKGRKSLKTGLTMTKMVDTAMAAVHLVKTDQVYNEL